MDLATSANLSPVAIFHSEQHEKFGIPRQSGLAPAIPGILKICAEYAVADAFRGIEEFSHLWLIFQFHQHQNKHWSPLIRPPRLGGNKKIGVFASRSSFRPNNLGLSVVKLDRISYASKGISLYVSGADLLDNTPVYDIKPYIGYADSIPDADCSYAGQMPDTSTVVFSQTAQQQLEVLDPGLSEIVTELLQQDPRPAYKKSDSNKIYGLSYGHLNIRFVSEQGVITVLDVVDT